MSRKFFIVVFSLLLLIVLVLNQSIYAIATKNVSIQVAIIDKNLNIKPVAKQSFEIFKLSDDNETPVSSFDTDFDGKAQLNLSQGKYTIKIKNPLHFENKSFRWEYTFSVSQNINTKIELSNNNAIIKEEVTFVTPKPEINKQSDDITLYNILEEGVVTVDSDGGKGSGFIIDDRGLIVTNHHVAGNSQELFVQFDSKTRVQAELITSKPEEDVAIIMANLKAYPNYKVLKIACPTDNKPIAVVGEKIVAIGSPLNQQKIITQGIVSKVNDDVIISDVNINHGNSGGPSLNSKGEVIGINTFGDTPPGGDGPGISGIVNISKAYDVINKARDIVETEEIVPPSAELLPTIGDTSYPLEALNDVFKKGIKPENYIFSAGGSQLIVMTPPLEYYRNNIQSYKAITHKYKRTRKNSARIRPEEISSANRNWIKYVGRYRPVVTFQVIPKVGLTGMSKFKKFARDVMGNLFTAQYGAWYSAMNTPSNRDLKLESEFKEDIENLELDVNGKIYPPLKRNILEQTVSERTENNKINDQMTAAVFDYDPFFLIPEKKDQKLEIMLLIHRANKNKPTAYKLPDKLVNQLKSDFVPYFQALSKPENKDKITNAKLKLLTNSASSSTTDFKNENANGELITPTGKKVPISMNFYQDDLTLTIGQYKYRARDIKQTGDNIQFLIIPDSKNTSKLIFKGNKSGNLWKGEVIDIKGQQGSWSVNSN